MNDQQLKHLENSLDRVPEYLLRQALSRREQARRLKHSLTPDQRKFYRTTLADISTRERVDVQTILSACRLSRVVALRWELYRRLDAHGLTTLEISTLTGHDRTRVENWKRKTRPVLQSLRAS